MSSNQELSITPDVKVVFTDTFISELNKFPRNAKILILSWIHKNYISCTSELIFLIKTTIVDGITFTKVRFHNFIVFITQTADNTHKFELITKKHKRETLYSNE